MNKRFFAIPLSLTLLGLTTAELTHHELSDGQGNGSLVGTHLPEQPFAPRSATTTVAIASSGVQSTA